MSSASSIKTEQIVLNMGPQHPSTHGVLRVVVTLDGEVITDVKPDIGFLHRGMEKIAENRTYPQFIPYTDRMDYLSSVFNNQVYCEAVEKLMGIEVPERAQYLRVIAAELNRISSHLVWLGTFALDLGALSVFLYCFREREAIMSLFEDLCGARMALTYLRIGGVSHDLPDGWVEKSKDACKYLQNKLDENDALLTGNEIFLVRTRDIGILPADRCLAYGVSGPMIRSAGIPLDLRKKEPYEVYDRLDFDVITTNTADVLGRYLIRVEEMRQSLKIVEQALRVMPDGEIKAKVPRVIKPPVGEVYHRIESPRGILGVYIESDGSTNPARLKWRSPCFVNLQPLNEMCRGWKIADVVAILGSVDIVLGEVDR